MANNYSISNWTTLENTGDNVINGTIDSPVYLYITPNAGYVVQASDFGIGSSLPPEVASVNFSDTTTALDITNTIKVTVDLASWYTHGSSDFTINIDIDGNTREIKPRLNFTTTNTDGSNVTQTLTTTNKSTTTSGGVNTNTCFFDIVQNTNTLVGSFVYTADSSYHLLSTPYLNIISNDKSKWSIVPSDQVYNDDGQLTSIKYSFYYNIGTVSIPLSSGECLIFDTPTAEANRSTCANISSVYYDFYKNGDVLSSNQNNLTLNVNGTEGATYNISIQDSIGLTYDFESNTFTSGGNLFSLEKNIYSPSKQAALNRLPNRNTHRIIIPENVLANATYTTTVTPTGSTKTALDCVSTSPFVISHTKFGVVSYVFTTAESTYGVNTADTSIKSSTGKKPLQLLSTFNPVDFPSLSTSDNGFFSYSQILGYTVNGTVSSHSSGTVVIVLTATTDSLKLRVGDTVTGTNIPANSTIASLEGGSTIKINNVADSTVSGVLVFTRTVGITRQPLASDIRTTTPITTYNGVLQPLSYAVSSIVSSTNVVLEATDKRGITDLTVGMMVQGQSIVGQPTIVSISNNSITISSTQAISQGDLLEFSVAGSKLEIQDINVTNAGTATCSLNIIGYIERVGNTNVTAEVVLSNFIATYAAPSISDSTATVPLGGYVIISPLEEGGFTSQSLEISEITSSGNAQSITISGDGQSIKYLAPLTGTSDTIQYKVTDGISGESSAINVVITLT